MAGSSPWPLLVGALMGCLGVSVVALKWRGFSASKTGSDKMDGQKRSRRSRRAKKNESMALTGGGSTAGTPIFFYFFCFVAMVGVCGVTYEASAARDTRGRGAMSGLLSVNSIVPESCPADAAGKARRLVETGLVGAVALRLGGIASLEPSAAQVRVAAAALLVGRAGASATDPKGGSSGPPPASCTTTGGSAPEGSTCVFPFFYNGVTYSECTKVANFNNPWCGIEAIPGTGATVCASPRPRPPRRRRFHRRRCRWWCRWQRQCRWQCRWHCRHFLPGLRRRS